MQRRRVDTRVGAAPLGHRVAGHGDRLQLENPLDTVFFDGHERQPVQPHAPPAGAFSHWLTVEQIRKMQRMRRAVVIQAMEAGDLPFESRGRIRYARLADVLAWEERRLTHEPATASTRRIAPELADLLG